MTIEMECPTCGTLCELSGEDDWTPVELLSASKPAAHMTARYLCTPKAGGEGVVIDRAPDSFELRDCEIAALLPDKTSVYALVCNAIGAANRGGDIDMCSLIAADHIVDLFTAAAPAQLNDDTRAAVDFYAANPNAALLDFQKRFAPAVVLDDERAQFEAWARTEDGGWSEDDLERKFGNVYEYLNSDVERDWSVWQARQAYEKAARELHGEFFCENQSKVEVKYG